LNDTIVISDNHIGDKRVDLETIRCMMQYIKDEYGDRRVVKLIINGDFLDSWSTDRWDMIKIFSAISIGQHETIIVQGNHDPLVLSALVPSGVQVVRRTEVKTDQGAYVVLHGHEYDINVNEFSWFWRWVYKAKEYLYSKFGIDIQKLLKFSLSKRHNSLYFMKVVWRSIEMNKNLHDRDYIGVVCGHTHFPTRLTLGGFEYLNSGDCIDNFTYVRISEDGKADIGRYYPVEKL